MTVPSLRIVQDLDAPEDLQALYETHWWFAGRELARIEQSVAASDVVVGLRDPETDRLVASGRVITDFVYTGKILDVIVHADRRRQGVGTLLLDAITGHPDLQEVDELTVNCRAGLAPFYRSCGFDVHEMIQAARDDPAEEDYLVMVHA